MKNFLLILFMIKFIGIGVTGCERDMTKPVMDTVASTETPAADNPEAFAVALVQAAIDLYKTGGREAVIATYNDPASIDGQWYVFITDENDRYVAHPASPDFVGQDIKGIPGLDGSPVGVQIANAPDTGHWTEYVWPNPETNKLEQKRTWSIRYDGYLFASGYYQPWAPDPASLPIVSKEDPEAFTRAFVLAAIARYQLEGREATIAYYNDPASIDGQWYVFISGENDIIVVHPTNPDLVGTDLKEIVSHGFPSGAEVAKATGTGRWTEYLSPDPVTGQTAQKRTWSIRHDGYLFGSGYYEPLPEGTVVPEN